MTPSARARRAIRNGVLAISIFLAQFIVAPASVADEAVAPDDVRIEAPWARASIGTKRPTAAYFSLVNNGPGPISLVGVGSPITGHAEVHRSVMQGEIMRMEPAGDIEVPAGASVVLKPGALHVMLMGLTEPLKKGEVFPLTLQFAEGQSIEIAVPIMGPGAAGPEKEE